MKTNNSKRKLAMNYPKITQYCDCLIPDNGLYLINAARHRASQIAAGHTNATVSSHTRDAR